mgnify:CR=1 FL=1
MLVPLNLTGGDYQHKSRPLSKQVTRNFWPQVQPNAKEKSPYILQSFYGLKDFKVQAGGVDRGMLENQGVLYKISGTTLYSVASDGTHTSLGTVTGSGRCIMWAMGAQIIITNGTTKGYTWDGVSTFAANVSVNIGLPAGVAVLNNQALYDAGSGQGFDVSDVGTPDTVNGLNNASAESASDALRRIYAFADTAYMGGDKTFELWWDSGQGNPPFDRIQGALIQMGLEAIHSMANDTENLFFFGIDKQVHTLTAGASSVDSVVSTPAMAKEFQDYTTTTDAIGWCMELEGQWFYVLTFPTEDTSWILPKGGEWFEVGSSLDGRWRANSYAFAFGKHLVADYSSANIYELDAETYTDAGETIVRTRDSASIHGGLFKRDGKEFELTSLELILETGIGLVSGQGSDPVIMVSVSNDGGKTFGTERMLRCGMLGEQVTVRTGSFGRFKECVIRLRVSDPIFWSIHSAVANIEFCI